MLTRMEDLSGWDWGAWIGIIIGVLGIIIGIAYGEWRARRPAKGLLVWEHETTPVSIPSSSEIEVRYQGEVVKRPFVTTIRLANRGPKEAHYVPDDSQSLEVHAHGEEVEDSPLGVVEEPANRNSSYFIDDCLVLKSGGFLLRPEEAIEWTVLSNGRMDLESRSKVAGVEVMSDADYASRHAHPARYLLVVLTCMFWSLVVALLAIFYTTGGLAATRETFLKIALLCLSLGPIVFIAGAMVSQTATAVLRNVRKMAKR